MVEKYPFWLVYLRSKCAGNTHAKVIENLKVTNLGVTSCRLESLRTLCVVHLFDGEMHLEGFDPATDLSKPS